MLDVSFRRGGADLDPDLRRHMDECGHCRYAADQLSQFNGDLAVPLAEAVLGWGARAYVASRQARAAAAAETVREPGTGHGDQGLPLADGATAAGNWPTAETARIVEFKPEADVVRPPGLPPLTPPVVPLDTGTAPTASETAAPRPATPSHPGAPAADGGTRPSRRRGVPLSGVGTRSSRRGTGHKAPRGAPGRRNVALAVLTVSALVLVPLVLWASDPGPDSTSGTADGSHSSAAPSRRTNPSWVGTGEQKDGTVRGRLRNAATGLCVGIAGTTPAIGVETRLIPCSSESATEYTYAADGLLRDADHPALCLDSHLGYSVQLEPCTGPSQPGTKNVRYDFTLQGMLVPRWNQDLALAPASAKAGAALVLKLRKGEPIQHWTLDTSSPSLQLEVVNWDSTTGDAKGSATRGRSTSSTSPAPTATRTPTATPSTQGPTAPTVAPSDGSCSALSTSCPGDGHNGSTRDGGYGTSSGSDGSGSYGGGGQGSRR
jgi:uncharacterized membrane protein YgcG